MGHWNSLALTFFISAFLIVSTVQASSYPEIGEINSTFGLVYDDYTLYSDYGSTDSWARIIIKGSDGTVIGNPILDVGEIETIPYLDMFVIVTNVTALQDGPILSANVIVGPSVLLEISSNINEMMEYSKLLIGFDTRTECSGTEIVVYVNHMGTDMFNSNLIDISVVDSDGNVMDNHICGNDDLVSGDSVLCDNTLIGVKGVNKITITGPTNTASATVYCDGESPEETTTTTTTVIDDTTTTTTTLAIDDTTTTTLVGTTTTTQTITTILKCPSGCLFDGHCYPFGERFLIDENSFYCDSSSDVLTQKRNNEMCQNDYECESNICINGKCSSGCDGCSYLDECVPVGFRDSDLYCSLDGEMRNKKYNEETCENNFECVSNFCVDGQCIEEGFLEQLLSWFYSVFAGLFRDTS